MTTIFQPRTPQHKHQHLSPAETQLLDLALADVGPAPAADDPTHAVAVTTSADQHVTTTTTPAETLRLSEKEEHILQLYRDLQEQDLERELLEEVKSTFSLSSGGGPDSSRRVTQEHFGFCTLDWHSDSITANTNPAIVFRSTNVTK